MSAVREHKPDRILLDLGLPAGDGFEVMSRLNEIPALELIPVVVLSGRTGQDNRTRALTAAARAFLEKPVDAAELLATIRSILGGHANYAET